MHCCDLKRKCQDRDQSVQSIMLVSPEQSPTFQLIFVGHQVRWEWGKMIMRVLNTRPFNMFTTVFTIGYSKTSVIPISVIRLLWMFSIVVLQRK